MGQPLWSVKYIPHILYQNRTKKKIKIKILKYLSATEKKSLMKSKNIK